MTLFEASDDRVDKPVYEGTLYIRSDATMEVAIDQSVSPLDPDRLNEGDWYNAVYFDDKGYVTRLVFVGD